MAKATILMVVLTSCGGCIHTMGWIAVAVVVYGVLVGLSNPEDRR